MKQLPATALFCRIGARPPATAILEQQKVHASACRCISTFAATRTAFLLSSGFRRTQATRTPSSVADFVFVGKHKCIDTGMLQRVFSTTLPAHSASVGAAVRRPTGKQPTRKAALTLTPAAVARLRELTSDPSGPKMLKIGTKKKGCSGQVYTLEYVTEKSRFDEVVEQDGVKVIIDSRALLSLLGSEMDYVESKLSSQFVFINPNVKEMCGCGQSFMT